MKQCPICEGSYIPYMGDGDVLILGSTPNEEELQYGKPFAGRNIALWKSHLMKYAKLDLHACRFGLLNTHSSKKEFTAECQAYNEQLAREEIAQVSRVVLVGADSVKWLTSYKIGQVNGMDVTTLIDGGDTRFFAMVTPATLFASQGEYYFAMERLGEWLNG